MKIKSTLILCYSLFLISNLQGQSIWSGPSITFTKANNAPKDSAVNQDRMSDSVWITRNNSQGIFNIKKETGYSRNFSPEDTEWAFGLAKDYKTLNFQDWETEVGSNPPGMVNRDMALHLVSENVYLDIKFTSWTSGGAGGGFTYIRSTCHSEETVTITTCDSLKSPSGKYVWRASGTYKDTIKNTYGCDSTITFKLTISNIRTIKVNACDSFKSPSGKFVWKTRGIYVDTLSGVSSCPSGDSFLIILLTVNYSSKSTITESVCDRYTSPSGKYTWTTSGTYMDTIMNSESCDSVITINLTVNKSYTTSVKVSACKSYTSPSGKYIWNFNGNFKDTIPTAAGCDSALLIALTINESSFRSFSAEACDQLVSPSGKFTWTTSGVKTDTILNSVGCDSILFITVTINKSPTKTMNVIGCNSYQSPSGKYTWTVSGTYKDTLKTFKLCDSILIINLTIGTPSSNTITVSSCERYYSPSGKYLWTTSGPYQDTITNASGCDSVLAINLTIIDTDATFSRQGNNFIANTTTGTIQWMSCNTGFVPISGETNQIFTAMSTGSYALQVSANSCIDTSSCYVHASLDAKDIKSINDAILYPNPNSGKFNITLGAKNDLITTRVFDIYGNAILSQSYSNTSNIEFDLSSQPSGIYLIRLENGNHNQATFKIIKN